MMIIIKNRCYHNKISNFLYLFYFSYIFFNNFLLFWNIVSWLDCNVRLKIFAVPLRADSRAKTGSRLPVMSRTVSLSTAISVILQREIKEWVIEYTNEKMNKEARKEEFLEIWIVKSTKINIQRYNLNKYRSYGSRMYVIVSQYISQSVSDRAIQSFRAR